VTAEVVSQYILHGQRDAVVDAFSPDRFLR
jgi:hypothetical protein